MKFCFFLAHFIQFLKAKLYIKTSTIKMYTYTLYRSIYFIFKNNTLRSPHFLWQFPLPAYRIVGPNNTGYSFNAWYLRWFCAGIRHYFNDKKSKCVLVQHSSASKVASDRKPQFVFGGSVIEYVDSLPHLGHIIASSNNDNLDIWNRRNSLWSD